MSLKNTFRKALRSGGYDIVSFNHQHHPLARRMKFLEIFAIDTVLDVGANTGQYGTELRNLGFQGQIISFEPLDDAFAALKSRTDKDKHWHAHHYALGECEKNSEINISGNLQSSSLLPMQPAHEAAAAASAYVGTQKISVKSLDDVLATVCTAAENIYVKMDVQGYEMQVLRGAEHVLPRINTLQLEISLTPLYDGAPTNQDIDAFMLAQGYHLIAIDPVFSDPETGRMLQVDGTYHRY